jgi:hypothetical protein
MAAHHDILSQRGIIKSGVAGVLLVNINDDSVWTHVLDTHGSDADAQTEVLEEVEEFADEVDDECDATGSGEGVL